MNKEELKDEIEKRSYVRQVTEKGLVKAIDLKVVKMLIDKLDISDADQAYKDGYETGRMHERNSEWVEIEKPIVPECVDSWIKACKSRNIDMFIAYNRGRVMEPKLSKWIRSNPERFSMAWRFGCEVEKEKEYLVSVGGLYLSETTEYSSGTSIRVTWDKKMAYRFKEETLAEADAKKINGKVEEI